MIAIHCHCCFSIRGGSATAMASAPPSVPLLCGVITRHGGECGMPLKDLQRKPCGRFFIRCSVERGHNGYFDDGQWKWHGRPPPPLTSEQSKLPTEGAKAAERDEAVPRQIDESRQSRVPQTHGPPSQLTAENTSAVENDDALLPPIADAEQTKAAETKMQCRGRLLTPNSRKCQHRAHRRS